MHTDFNHGVATVETGLFLKALNRHGIGFDALQPYCSADREFAKGTNRLALAKAVFDPEREFKDSLKCLASEMLCVLPLLRHLTETALILPSIAAERASFLAMCEVCSILQQTKRQFGSHLASRLRAAQMQHRRLFVSAYGASECKPKHHFSLHLPAQIFKTGFLIDAFVLERKHKTGKKFGSRHVLHNGWEASVLARCMADQISAYDENTFIDSLIGPRTESTDVAATLGVPQAIISENMQFEGKNVAVDDVIISGQRALLIRACVFSTNGFELIVKPYTFWQKRHSATVYKPENGLDIYNFADAKFHTPDYWTFEAAGTLLVI